MTKVLSRQKDVFCQRRVCRNKSMLVATKRSSGQIFVATNIILSRRNYKLTFVATNMCLSRQKWYLRQLPPMIAFSICRCVCVFGSSFRTLVVTFVSGFCHCVIRYHDNTTSVTSILSSVTLTTSVTLHSVVRHPDNVCHPSLCHPLP